jgi:hypothetical protein
MATLKTRTDYICIAAEMAELPTVGVGARGNLSPECVADVDRRVERYAAGGASPCRAEVPNPQADDRGHDRNFHLAIPLRFIFGRTTLAQRISRASATLGKTEFAQHGERNRCEGFVDLDTITMSITIDNTFGPVQTKSCSILCAATLGYLPVSA